jgi:hypothetical protein
VKRLVSIAALLAVASLWLATPLLAGMLPSCCRASKCDDTLLRPDTSCCKVSSLPGGAARATIADSPMLPAPAVTSALVPQEIALGVPFLTDVVPASNAISPHVPLRI